MIAFTYQALPGRVIFRAGAIDSLPAEVERLGRRALVLSTPEQAGTANSIAALIGDRAVGVFTRAEMHVPVEVAAAAREEARRRNADCCVAVGGGSTIGLGKAIALDCGLPIIAIPTTYAGSEATPIWGLTEAGRKRTGRDPKVLPRTVIYDPELTLTMPASLASVSGLNAIAHCVEALYAEDANPVISLFAEEGIRALSRGLVAISARGDDIEARSQALYGAWLAGVALGSVKMGLHHKLCHTLGGSFGMPHAETHAVLIPYVVAYNQNYAEAPLARAAAALGAQDAASGLFSLAQSIGAPRSLQPLGFGLENVEQAAEIAMQDAYSNPRQVTRDGIIALLTDAVLGRRPRAD